MDVAAPARVEPADRYVLLVEDDVDIRCALSEAIEFEGCQVMTAQHGREALDLLESGCRPFLIILDMNMPVMDGRAFLAAYGVGLALPRIPVMVVSANVDRKQVEGVAEYIQKPIDLGDLLDRLGKYR